MSREPHARPSDPGTEAACELESTQRAQATISRTWDVTEARRLVQ